MHGPTGEETKPALTIELVEKLILRTGFVCGGGGAPVAAGPRKLKDAGRRRCPPERRTYKTAKPRLPPKKVPYDYALVSSAK